VSESSDARQSTGRSGIASDLGQPRSSLTPNALGFDPGAAPSLWRFWAIQGSTECVFAEASVMWGCPDWEVGLGLELNLTAWLPVLERFVQESEERKLDGLVLEMPGSAFGDSVDALGQTTARVLRFLSSPDAAGHNRMNEVIEDPSWWFSFAGQKLFVLTFGPCYSRHSSRYGFGSAKSYVVFQPIHCFSRRIPDGATQISQRARRQIRRRYQASGRSYDLAITLSPFEAYRYVKPASLGDPPVKWWQQVEDPD
jgi:hypothetical protein